MPNFWDWEVAVWRSRIVTVRELLPFIRSKNIRKVATYWSGRQHSSVLSVRSVRGCQTFQTHCTSRAQPCLLSRRAPRLTLSGSLKIPIFVACMLNAWQSIKRIWGLPNAFEVKLANSGGMGWWDIIMGRDTQKLVMIMPECIQLPRHIQGGAREL